jgi:hypothetical protein
MPNAAEGPLQGIEKIAFGAALKDLAEKYATRFENIDREGGGGFGKPHDPQVIGLGMADCRSGHIGKDNVSTPAPKPRLQQLLCPRISEIHLNDLDTRDRLKAQIVNGNDLTPALGCLDPLGGYLGPPTRCGAEVNHALAGLQDMVAGIDLAEFESRSRSQAFAF